MPRNRFSERHGYTAQDAEISVRHDAPHDLRGVVVDLAYEAGLSPKSLRSIVCRTLRTREDPDNWSEWPNIAEEVTSLVDGCEWFEVYDVIEAIYASLERRQTRTADGEEAGEERFARELNNYFRRRGIGWQLVDGELTVRGPEAFEKSVRRAEEALEETDRATARQELKEALHDLSRRPTADVTGAIQHAMAALECVARDVTGNAQATLGDILRRNPGLLPRPLDQAVEKVWGFASERGRHLREGREPDIEDAELVVGLASVVSTYLVRKDAQNR